MNTFITHAITGCKACLILAVGYFAVLGFILTLVYFEPQIKILMGSA